MELSIDPYKRYQTHLSMRELYPSIKGYCSCGCGTKLTGRQTRWCSPDHVNVCLINYRVIQGDITVIRRELLIRDHGVCNSCKNHFDYFEADHIFPVHQGGGGCTLENFQTLCYVCHKKKTISQRNQLKK